MFGYSLCIYCLQEESIHFDLMVSTNFGLEASGHFSTKNYTRQIDKTLKFLYIVFCPKSFRYLQVIYFQHVLVFICKNWFYHFFLLFWHASIQSSGWMLFHRHKFFAYIIIKCFALFKFVL